MEDDWANPFDSNEHEFRRRGCQIRFQISERRLLQVTHTTSFYKLTGIYLPTWSWWQRAAISGWAMSFPTHSGHCRGSSPMQMGQWERRTKLLWPVSWRSMCYQQNRSLSLVTITDGMNLVQKMKGQIFSQLADSALTHILQGGIRSRRIDMVFDAHRED